MSEIATTYADVLGAGDSRLQLAKDIIKILKANGSYTSVESLVNSLGNISYSDSLVKKMLNLLSEKEHSIISKTGSKLREKFRLVETNEKRIESVLDDLFSEKEQEDQNIQDHINSYGFSELIKSVSRQVNHENIIIKEISEDRLWLGRYIDFLEEAKQYVSWQKMDQAIAKEKIRRFKKQNKSGN